MSFKDAMEKGRLRGPFRFRGPRDEEGFGFETVVSRGMVYA
jgi:hypothetical protein